MSTCSGTVLLVDDDDVVRLFAAEMLKAAGCKVFEANSGEKALAVFQEHQAEIQMVLSDVVMPGMFGDELVLKLLELQPDLRYILMSGNPRSSLETEIPLEEDVNFLQKPFSIEDLRRLVRGQLEISQRR